MKESKRSITTDARGTLSMTPNPPEKKKFKQKELIESLHGGRQPLGMARNAASSTKTPGDLEKGRSPSTMVPNPKTPDSKPSTPPPTPKK